MSKPDANKATSGRRTSKSSATLRRKVAVGAKLWLEVDGNKSALTEAGADLLEQIIVTGSLSAAARNLGFAYRRAWLLVDAMNSSWPERVVTTATGGKQGGGAKVTEKGLQLLAAYRDLQIQLEHLLDSAVDDFR